MAILAECPVCHKRQTLKNKKCSCGENLYKAKQSKRVKFWIDYRLKDGTHCREALTKFADVDPYSLDDARNVFSKRKVQKKENRIFEIKGGSTITFQELTTWYLSLESVKALKSYYQVSNSLRKFNLEFGDRMVKEIKPSELENHKVKRKNSGIAESTVDQEIGAAKAVINKAFLDGMVDDVVFKIFKQVKKFLTGKRKDSNKRDRVLSHKEFLGILSNLPAHSRGVFVTGYYTGMRLGETLALTWNMVSLKDRKITLPKEITKDKEERTIPIGDTLFSFLKKIPTPIHDSHVFLNNGKPIKDIRGGLKMACVKAGVLYGRFKKGGFVEHDLKHGFITSMRKSGVHDGVTNAITGHSDGTMRSRYDTVDFNDLMEGIKKLEFYLKNVAKVLPNGLDGQEKRISQMSANPL